MSASSGFRNVSKAYRLRESRRSFREALSGLGRHLLARGTKDHASIHWALRDVTFDILPGEILGIIGPNGAGKTTILKLLSKITQPTSGRISVHGRVAALIELGAGFHPDLTGRENIFLNAAILGIPLKEVQRRFEEIVHFSGLERFIDIPIKRYSSGMYVRLAFSVAAHVQADILLVDEVLAVGDAQFRQQCIKRIKDLRRKGASIAFVSHNHYLVESICDRCIFLANGEVNSQGEVASVLDAYEIWSHREQIQDLADQEIPGRDKVHSPALEITKVEVRGAHGPEGELLHSEDVAEVRVYYRAFKLIHRPNLYVKILQKDGSTCCMIRTADYGYVLDDLEGAGSITVAIDPVLLTPGAYMIDAELLEDSDFSALAQRHSGWFRVDGNSMGREGVFVPRVAWVRIESE